MCIRVNLRLIVENNALLTSFEVWQQIVKLFILYGKYRKSIAFFIFIFTQQKCIFLETNKFEKKYFSGDKVVTTISCLQRHTRQQLRQSVGQTIVACRITAKYCVQPPSGLLREKLIFSSAFNKSLTVKSCQFVVKKISQAYMLFQLVNIV